jgi:thiol:disulfide interchange protein DsbD
MALIPGTNAAQARAFWESPIETAPRSLVIEWAEPKASTGFDFFPYEKQPDISAKTVPTPSEGPNARIRKTVAKSDNGWPTTVRGVLATTGAGPALAAEVTLTIAAAPASGTAGKNPQREPIAWGSVLPMLGFAFLGGLLLNIMPCVLPVLALKILGFVNQAKSDPKYVRQLGLIYGLGVILSFVALATLALIVQKAGGVAGWSTAFQNPGFRIGLTLLMTLVALNLFGLFEVTLHPTATETAFVYASKEGPAGAFFNGVLAAALATPCTAPFLGVAIGFAFTQPPLILLMFFVMAGMGLALPFVVLCWEPAWLKMLPRPGHWMERFKVAMGFPMLATAVWLFWFTATRMGEAGVLWFGLCLVTLAAAAWVWGEFVQRASTRRVAGSIATVVLIAFSLFVLLPKASERSKIQWQKWSPEAVTRAVAEGHPVLVDFTADNCLNCKFNKKTSIEIASTIQQLNDTKTVTFEGDFTDADPQIAQELNRYGRRGVPLVLIYSKVPGREPKVLPTLLTPTMVHEALDWASKP